MIQNAAFFVNHPDSKFIGIVAYDLSVCSAKFAAIQIWGSVAGYQELTDEELLSMTKDFSVFTASYNG